jgi:hypothetical protein
MSKVNHRKHAGTFTLTRLLDKTMDGKVIVQTFSAVVEMDLAAIAERLGARAARSKSKTATALEGAVRVKAHF